VYTGSALSGAGGGEVLVKSISKASLMRVDSAIRGMQQPIPVSCVQSVRSSGSQVLTHFTRFTGTEVQILTAAFSVLSRGSQVLTLLALLVQKYQYRVHSVLRSGSRMLTLLTLLALPEQKYEY